MALTMRPVLIGSLLPLLCACGGATKEPPKTASTAPPPAPLQVAAPAPDLSPVAAPAELVVLGRFARPAPFLTSIAGWVGVPFNPTMIDAIEPGLSEALALGAPIEFAVALPSGGKVNQDPNVVVSIGVNSTERAKSLLQSYNGSALKEQSPGVWVAAADAKAACAIAASVGKVSTRLVCATESRGLAAMLPYVTRGLPLEDLGTSDLRAEFRLAPLQQRFAAAARMGKVLAVPELLSAMTVGDPRFDRPLADAAHAVGDELLDWFEDLDRIRIDLTAQANPEQFDARFSIDYKSRKSLIASSTASAKGRMGPPSPMFFELPANATRAGYTTATETKPWEKAITLTSAVSDGFLAHLNIGAELRQELTKGMKDVLSRGDALVAAQLNVPSPSGKGPSTDAQRMATMLGQYVVGLDGPAAPYQAWLKSLTKLYNDRTFKHGIDQLLAEEREISAGSNPSHGGKAKAKPKPMPMLKKSLLELVKVKLKTLKGLPAGSEVVTLTVTTKDAEAFISDTQKKLHRRGKVPKLAVEKVTLCLAVIPDGARTWMLMATDDQAIESLAKTVLPGSTVARLGTRPELAMMRGQSASSAGFFSLLSLKGYLTVMLQTAGKSGSDAESLFSTLPHHGETAAFYQFSSAGDDQRPTFEGRVTLPRAMFDDAAAAVPTLMMSF